MIKTQPVRQALDYYVQAGALLSTGRACLGRRLQQQDLISGKSALILNPPSAWAVAKRDAPKVAEQRWTHGMPAGPKGRFSPASRISGALVVRQEQVGGQEPASLPLAARAIEKMVAASQGFDIPAFANLTTIKTWAEEGPPRTLYHYPNRYDHQIVSIAGAPAPPKIAVQIYVQGVMTKMTVRHMQGEPMEKTLAWAESEVEGFLRT